MHYRELVKFADHLPDNTLLLIIYDQGLRIIQQCYFVTVSLQLGSDA